LVSAQSVSLYDATSLPLVVGRSPSLPAVVAVAIYESADPLAAARDYFAGHQFARCALASASPTLAHAVSDWIAGRALRNQKTPLRALAYLVRMASRPTPFGLCAGVGMVEIGATTDLGLDEQRSRTLTRPDMGLMLQLARGLERASPSDIKYVTNDAVFERGGRLFVVNVALTNPIVTEHGLEASEQRAVSLKNTDAVRLVRKLCATPTPYDAIVAMLAGTFKSTSHEAQKMLDLLVRAGIVISELHPSPLGEPAETLCGRLASIGAPPALGASLALARAIDVKPLDERDEGDYQRLHDAFAVLATDATNNVVQTDLRIEFTGALHRQIIVDASRLAELYVRSGPILTLSKLRRRFEEFFESGERMIPLLELVDPNVGLGVPEAPEPPPERTQRRDALLLRIACDAIRALSAEVELEPSDLDTIFPAVQKDDALPPALEIGFQIAAASIEHMNGGQYSIVPSGFIGSIGVAKSLGRFATMLGPDVIDRARTLARSAFNGDEIAAELAYAPSDGRAYNVYTRPLLYEYEVRVGVGSPPLGKVISLDDLWIGLDVNGFYLWSLTLQRRVSVRETHLFNTAGAAPNICRFLSLLETQGNHGIVGFSWGPASGLTYLPRIRTGRIVLSPRRWLLERALLGRDAATAERAISAWRTRWNVPRYVSLAEFDQRLLIDLDSSVAAQLVTDQNKAQFLQFYEALPDPTQTWLKGTRGAYFVEFIASAVRTQDVERRHGDKPIVERQPKRYGPGSAWTYARIYLGAQALDDHLRFAIAPLVAELREAGLMDRWFFVRYADPHNHLRLRLRATTGNERAVRERFLELAEVWLDANRISRYMLDTYDPEYERYGGAGNIDEIERFFEFDSDLCIGIIDAGVAATDDLVEAAVSSFDACIRSTALDDDVVIALNANATRKLDARDRACFKRLSVSGSWLTEVPSASAFRSHFRDLLHLHCNRLSLHDDAEVRVAALLRALAISRQARRLTGVKSARERARARLT